MSDEKLKKVLIGFVAFIVLLFLTIIIVRISRRVSPAKEQAQYEKEREKKITAIETGKITGKYESNLYNYEYLNLTQDQRTQIDEVTDLVLDLINKHDVETIWSMMNTKYGYELFPDRDYLKKYMERNFPQGKEYKSYGFKLEDQVLYISVGTDTPSGEEEEDVKYVRIDGFDQEKKIFYFGYYKYMENIRIILDKDQVLLDCYTIMHYDNETDFIFRAKNKTKDNLHIDFLDCAVYVQNARSYTKHPQVEEPQSFDIEPDGMEICEVKFKGFSKAAQKVDLKVRLNNDDNQVYEANNLFLSYLSGADGD